MHKKTFEIITVDDNAVICDNVFLLSCLTKDSIEAILKVNEYKFSFAKTLSRQNIVIERAVPKKVDVD